MAKLFESVDSPGDRIVKAKMKLLSDDPFYASVLMSFQIVECSNIETMAVSEGGVLSYSPTYVSSLTLSQLATELKHETLHVVLQHHRRFRDFCRSHPASWKTANLAMDFVIDSILRSEGSELPPEVSNRYFDRNSVLCVRLDNQILEIGGKSFEEIVSNFPPEADLSKVPLRKSGDGKTPDIDIQNTSDMKGALQQTDDSSLKIRSLIRQATEIAKLRGKLPGSLKTHIELLLYPKVPWKQRLRRLLSSTIGKSNYRYSKPGKKSFSCGYLLPSTYGRKMKAVIHVDTSGSCHEFVPEFLTEIRNFLKMFPSSDLTLILCGNEIASVLSMSTVSDVDSLCKDIELGCGTSHTPVVDWVLKNEPQLKTFITLTDGLSNLEIELPRLPPSCWKYVVMPDGYSSESFDRYADDVIKMEKE